MNRRLLAIAALLLLSTPFAAAPAKADKIYLRTGKVIEGKIVKEDAEHVQVEMKMGSTTVDRDNIDHIERVKTPEAVFEEELAKAKTADDLVKLGKKAKTDGLDSQASRAFEKALSLDKDCKDAHEARGDHLLNGKWYTEKEWQSRPEAAAAREQEAKDKAKKDATASEAKYGSELDGVGWGDAHVIVSKNYVVKCNSTMEIAQRYSDFLEKIRAAYEKVFSSHKHYWSKPSNVYIFRNNQEFQEYNPGVGDGVGGYYRPVSDNTDAFPDRVVSAFHGRFGAAGDTRLVLAHECTHQIEHILCQGEGEQFLLRPAWWAEGFAVYFGDGFKLDKKGNLTVGIPRDRLSILQQVIRAKVVPDQLKISQFVRWDIPMYQRNAGIAYPFGWSLVYYFLHRGEDAKGVNHPVKLGGKDIDLPKVLDKFFNLVTELPPKVGPDEIADVYGKKLDECLGIDIDLITDDWQKYVMDLQLPKLGKITGEQFDSTDTAFSVTKPKAWKWNENDVQGDDAIWMLNDASSGWIRISVDGNMNNHTPEQIVSETDDNLKQEIDQEGETEKSSIDVNGFAATVMIYRGTQPDQKGALPTAVQRTGKQYVRRVVIATRKRTYHIICQCDDGKEDANKESFDQVVASFKVLKDKEN